MNKIRLLLLLSFSILFQPSLCIAQSPLVKKWDHRYGGPFADQVYSLQQTKDGGYILGGNSDSGVGGDKTQPVYGGHGDYDYWIVKTDSLGNKQWDKDFGGTTLDLLYSVEQTTDRGYILGGSSSSGISGSKTQSSVGGDDYWIIKTDSLGNEQWEKDFGGTLVDDLYSVQQTTDGGYILGGLSNSGIGGDKTQACVGGQDYWIIKTDALGNKQWDKTFGGSGSDVLLSIQQTKDGGYILGGHSDSGISGDKTQNVVDSMDFWIVKVDSLGNKQWDRDFGGTGIDGLQTIKQTTDGGYIFGGYSDSPLSGDKTQASFGLYDFWLVKTDSLGNKQWDSDFGGTNYEDMVGNLSQTTDGGYLIAGTSYSPISGSKTESNLGQEQTWVVKTDPLGNKQWDKTVFTNGHEEMGLAIQTKDGCYAFANYTPAGIGGYKTQTSQGAVDFWIVKFCDSTQSILPLADFVSSDTVFCGESGACVDFTDHSVNNPTSWKWYFPGAVPDTSTQQNPTGICYYNPGTYAVKLVVTNSYGSDSITVSPMITFAAGAAPPVLSFSGDTIYCSHAAAYQWYFNGSSIPSATDSFYVTTGDGVYAVQITDGNGCSRLSNGLTIAVNELNGTGEIKIYPNPANEELWVMSYGLLPGKTKVEIHNVLEESVLQSEISNQQSEINVSGLAKGIYIIEVVNRDKVFRTKFVKD